MDKPYYLAYEERYQTAFAAGIDYWGHDPGDTTLAEALDGWVRANRLSGRRVIEFACGEGAAGILLSRLGCRYLGVDIAPSAVEKTKQRLAGFQNAQVRLLDMVTQAAGDRVRRRARLQRPAHARDRPGPAGVSSKRVPLLEARRPHAVFLSHRRKERNAGAIRLGLPRRKPPPTLSRGRWFL